MVEKRKRTTQTLRSRLMSKKRSKRATRKRSSAKKFRDIPGLFQVRISPSLQSILSCRIGINITSNERWIYIYKEKLLDAIKSRQSQNEKGILQIQAEVESFPKEYILIGSYGGDEFFLCLSEYATNVCENWMEEEKKEILRNLSKCLYREAFEWYTLGSDYEIERIISDRSPLCLVLERQLHLHIKFDMRLVKDVKDGYAEFVNPRTTFNILFRRRLDKSSQVSGIKNNKCTQTNAPARTNRSVQYNYTYPEVQIKKGFHLRLNKWFAKIYNDISSHMSSINIFTNDYLELPNQKTRNSIANPNLIMSFHDCVACHDKMVICIAWNAHMSGVVAAAYGRVSPKFICKTPPIYTKTQLKEKDTHLVLIWSVTQPSKPLLYLHAKWEITAMNFCPFNPNILVGGTTDGQIIVWDLGGKIDAQKIESPLQSNEVNVLIRETMSWMKYPPNEQHVFPCIESNFETSQKSHITGIKWLPPEHYLNNRGEFEECQNNEQHMQFLTTAIDDSTMLVWDIQPNDARDALTKKKKKKQFISKPKALTENKSRFAYLNFKPMFQLVFIDAATKRPIYVNNFSFKMGAFSYEALNPETMDNAEERTYFVRNKNMEHFTLEKNFLAATGFGELYHCSWDAYDYDLGLSINRQNIDAIPCASFHDGPIYHMQRHPFCADLVLTTGGRVLAIWYTIGKYYKKPIIWRKAAMRYVMAFWSSQNASTVIASREDGKIELWDFDEDSKSPLRMTKLKGPHLLSVFINNSFQHVMKNTCFTSDYSGVLSIYATPSKLFVDNKHSKLRDSIEHFYKRRPVLEYWNDYVIRQRGQIDNDETDPTDQDETTKRLRQCSTETHCISFKEKMCPANIWQEKEYKRMYKILIERQRINLVNVEKNKGQLNDIIEGRLTRMRKIDHYITNKEKIYQEKKRKLTAVRDMSKKPRVSISFPKEISKLLKEQFYENYKIVEIEANKYIQSHRYKFFFDWKRMMKQARRHFAAEPISVTSSVLMDGHQPRQTVFNMIPPNVGKKNTKVLMKELALVSSISGNKIY